MKIDQGVRDQVTRILDENSARHVSVILQAPTPELDIVLAEAMKRPLLGTQAPLPLPAGKKNRRSQFDRSLALGPAATIGKQIEDNEKRVGLLLNNALVSNSRLARQSDDRGIPSTIWLAGAAVMTMDRDDIAKIPTQMPNAVAVFPNRRITVPPRMQAQSVPKEIEQRSQYTWGLEVSGALSCWGAFNARGAEVKVAVLDTGVEASHPDLIGQVVAFAEFDANGNTFNSGVSNAYDDNGHGTHVSGTIAGGNASGRWIGMAPLAKIIAAKVLKNGKGTDAQILAGMAWAVQHGAHILNLSLGGWTEGIDVIDTYTTSILKANSLGIPVVAAIGNEGGGTSGSPGTDFYAFGVGATDFLDRAAGFSGGRTHVIQKSMSINPKHLPLIYIKPDLAAPGVDVYSAKLGGKWEYLSGTSMATPHVSGALAILLSGIGGKGLPSHDVRSIKGWDRFDVLRDLLLGSARKLGENGQNARFGHGRLDIASAYSNALNLKHIN